MTASDAWPELRYDDWKDTCATLHRWTQVAGKIRLALMPMINHWWQVPLYVTARGLTTSPMPVDGRDLELVFDFIDHEFRMECSDGAARTVRLEPKSVAAFYREVMEGLAALGVQVHVWPVPSEIPVAEPLDVDEAHRSYDPDYAQRFWRVLVASSRVMTEFRGRFLGKASPVHFFWGSFDLAATRFSGRAAPPHPGSPILPDWITREAYSHECSSAGFWPGGEGADAIFYAYAYPEPDGFKAAAVAPKTAAYSAEMGEFVLPYEAVRASADPAATLMAFLETTYAAAADHGQWDRKALER
jgi:uncharacterized protein DUF5996